MKKILKTIGLILLLALAVLLAALFWYRGASQPQIEGRLQLKGAGAAIDIVRDAEGVPHIYAQSTADAYFALGFVHAQDRLWQMEMNRRIPAGTMAEILGPNAEGADRFLRTLGVRRNAEAILQNLAPDARAALDAYAGGVNAYLSNRKGPLPPEFLLSGAPAPAPWQAVDSIGWQTMMSWDLGANWTQELLRMRLAQRLPLARINQFMPPYPGDAPLPTQDYTQLYRQLSGTAQQLAAVAAIAPPSYVEGMGSNNWVLAGSRTESGKPLLANDPHLGLSAPALWYFAHLSAPGLNVIGATLPGLPAVVLGRNDRIAWGFTNTAPDVQDLYIERINPANPKQYQTPDGWREFQTRSETIKVKGQPDVTLEVRESRHGPIISGALPLVDHASLDAKNYAMSFAWTALRPDDLTLQAGVRMNLAANWQEFLASARDFSSPQQNMVYADVDGNIGFVAPGRVPIRKAENDLHGLAPAPGWDARYDWAGFIPFESLPHQFNPDSHQVITANQKIVASDYPYFLTSEWSLPYRSDRIAELIAATPKHSLTSFGAIQKDALSLAARQILPALLQTRAGSEQARTALAALAKWDGTMDIGHAEPLIFNGWLRELSRRMFADELGQPLLQDYWSLRNVQQPLANILMNQQQLGAWCGNARDPAATNQGPALCAKVLTESLDSTLADLQQRYGDPAHWQWGQAHMARSEHRPFGKVPLLAKLFDIRVPSAGDGYTVNVGRFNLNDEQEPFTSRHAPSLRALYDLSDPENSRYIHSTGQSGNVLSPLYRNFTGRWANVAYLPMQMLRQTVEKNQLGTLTLEPR
jgi:penicillin G amidase